MPEFYLTPYSPRRCAWGPCGRTATQELRNRFNETVNWYCSAHASRALRDIQAPNKVVTRGDS